MRALVLGHSFIRRLRDWMRVNGRVMRHGNLDVHLHGVGGRTVPQVYHLDMQLVERISPDVILLQLGGNDINDTTSATDVLVKLKRLITVLREKHPDSTIIVASIFCRRRPRGLSSRSYDRKKKRVNKFLLKEFGGFEQGKKVFFFTHKFFKEKRFDRDGVHFNDDGNRCFYHSIFAALRLVLWCTAGSFLFRLVQIGFLLADLCCWPYHPVKTAFFKATKWLEKMPLLQCRNLYTCKNKNLHNNAEFNYLGYKFMGVPT